MSDELQVIECGTYYGVVIPFGRKNAAEKCLIEINNVLNYGGWIYKGEFNEDD